MYNFLASSESGCGTPRHFTAQRKSVGIGGSANIDQAAPSKLDLSARAPVMMMTLRPSSAIAASAASPGVVNVLVPARCEIDSPVGQNAFDFAGAGSTARLSRHQIGVCVKSEFVRRFNTFGLSSPKAKIFYFRFSEICGWLQSSHPRGEGRLAIVTNVGVGCGGRRQRRRDGIAGRVKACERVSRARKTNGAEADGKSVWSWHPLLVSSRRRRVGPTGHGHVVNSPATEARRIRLRGEYAISRKTIACGNAG